MKLDLHHQEDCNRYDYEVEQNPYLTNLYLQDREYFKKFYSNEGPGVIVFRPDFPEKEQMEYVSVNRLINILEKAKEAGQNCEIISKAINMAEAVDGEKEGLFIIEDEKDTQLFRINPERMVGSLL